MKLEAYGELVLCKEVKSKHGAFTMNEPNKAEVVSVGKKVKDVNEGDVIFYEANKSEAVEEYIIIHMSSIMCKVIE